MIDPAQILSFLERHARQLDRRRGDLLFGNSASSTDSVLDALAAYRNPDGGFGWGLEPDLRAPSSQPAGALHAFEALAEIAPATSPMTVELADWLETVTLPGGGLPFALPGAATSGTAPWWATADPTEPSLHITAAVLAEAHRVARHDTALAEHPWLERATAYALNEIARLDGPPHAIAFRFIIGLLDTLHGTSPEARKELERLGAFLPKDGTMPVEGGVEGEAMRPLDFAPLPGGPVRALLDSAAIERDLDRLESKQQTDGGWPVEWAEFSPAGVLEWRGALTVLAVHLLKANGRA